MSESIFKDFTNKYSLSKTLRFELKPVGKTVDWIKEKGLVSEDEQKAEFYKKAKKIIDEYHKVFIERVLSEIEISSELLNDIYRIYVDLKKNKNDEKLAKEYANLQEKLRKGIRKGIENFDEFKKVSDGTKQVVKIFSSKLLKGEDSLVRQWISTLPEGNVDCLKNCHVSDKYEADEIIRHFEKWTSYFTGFNENRKNVYKADPIPTSIIYRIVNDNLPRFMDNVQKWDKVKEWCSKGLDFSGINSELLEELTFSNVDKETGEIITKQYSLDDIFSLDNFNNCLSQSGIDKFNFIIGGKFVDGESEKRKGINEYINQFSQQYRDEEGKAYAKQIRSLKMTTLFKQILSDRDSHSFTIDKFENDKQVIDAINVFYKNSLIKNIDMEDNSKSLKTWISELFFDMQTEYNLQNIHLKNDTSLSSISKFIYGDWGLISKGLELLYIKNNPYKKAEPSKKELTEKNKWLKSKSFSISEVEEAIALFFESNPNVELFNDESKSKRVKQLSNPICHYFKESLIKKDNAEKKIFDELELTYKQAQQILSSEYFETGENNKELIKQSRENDVERIKEFLDSINDVLHFYKPLDTKINTQDKGDRKKGDDVHELEKDSGFYGVFDICFQQISGITNLYNKVRNYITQKPYSNEKFKLNFEKPKLLGGFVDSKTEKSDNATQFAAYIFRKLDKQFNEYEYFLGVSSNVKLFRCHLQGEVLEEDKSEYERLEYYQPKSTTFFSNIYSENKEKIINVIEKNIIDYVVSAKDREDVERILKRNDKEEITLGTIIDRIKKQKTFMEVFEVEEVKSVIKNTINELKLNCNNFLERNPQLKEIIDRGYEGTEGFTQIVIDLQDVANRNKVYSYFNISNKEYEKAVNDASKPLYLFRVSNKDLNFCEEARKGKRKQDNRGKDNLHTTYFKALMREFCSNSVFDLGSGELFYRKASINEADRIIHQKNEKIKNKNENNPKKESKFDYDLIKNRRYTKDKFLFHLSIALNFSEPKKYPEFNTQINKLLKSNKEKVHVLSIDRGERHLAYYTLLTPEGKIKDQGTFNIISNKTKDGVKFKNDYHEKLAKVEGNRDEARKNWKKIENIKELKEGYLSQVVHKIAKMVIDNNAIVVFEDLNFGFKKGRFKVEKQVYQKLEKMLIDKLNYLVFKDKKQDETGGVLKAYQLTEPFDGFYKMGKQTGIIFYVPAYHTSKIDPATGFVNLLYPKYESEKQAKDFFSKFKQIKYNKQKDYFEFTFDYNDFHNKAEGVSKTKWTVCSFGKRLLNYRNPEKNSQWDTKEVIVTEVIKELFNDFSIDYVQGDNLFTQISLVDVPKFYKDLIYYLKLVLQMRNSRTGTEEDYLISPVADNNGNFFNSDEAEKDMPQDADANGAYHIGLKGLMVVNKINKWNGEDKKLDFSITNKEWYEFVQQIKE